MARIAGFFHLQIDHQAATLAINARDIERGYVEAPAASYFSVITNAQDGIAVDFRPRSDVFQSMLVTGLQGPVEIARGDIRIFLMCLDNERRVLWLLFFRLGLCALLVLCPAHEPFEAPEVVGVLPPAAQIML